MKYLQPTFTLPASQKTPQEVWDMAFMSNDEFKKKYGKDKKDKKE